MSIASFFFFEMNHLDDESEHCGPEFLWSTVLKTQLFNNHSCFSEFLSIDTDLSHISAPILIHASCSPLSSFDMAPPREDDWSDSEDEDLAEVETSVLLGVPDGPVDIDTDLNDVAVSRIGGHPVRSMYPCLNTLCSFVFERPS